MTPHIAYITIVVDDYDAAITFYTSKLGFDLIENTELNNSKRWVVVAPNGSQCKILLAKASNEDQRSRVGNQTGGRVFLFLHTDNFNRDYQALVENGVEIVRNPSKEAYGTVAVFKDLYGNLWDLVEPVT